MITLRAQPTRFAGTLGLARRVCLGAIVFPYVSTMWYVQVKICMCYVG